MKIIEKIPQVYFKETKANKYRTVPAVCVVGKAGGRVTSRGDLTLYWDHYPTNKVFINSAVLKNALLNSKDYFRTELGLDIKDLSKKEFLTPEIVAKEIVPVVEDVVVQNPKPKFTAEQPEVVEPILGFETKTLDTMTVKELREVAEKKGIEVPFVIKKADLLNLIKGE
jgi:hypothetical protein